MTYPFNNTTETNKEILNLENTAELLGVSIATVQNWIKTGRLSAFNNKQQYFYKTDVENIKLQIINGNWNKLNKRANKLKAVKTFIPSEYIKNLNQFEKVQSIIDFIKKNEIDTKTALFLLSLNILKNKNFLLKTDINNILKNKKISCSNEQVQKELIDWALYINQKNIKSHFSFLLDCELPKQRDILGICYQSLLLEGKKSQSGSYYTPSDIVQDIVMDYTDKNSKVLDPCCGTGQFLVAFSDIVKNPLNIYGFDCDKTAVRIARLNLLMKFKNKNFEPKIFYKNTLFDIDNNDLFNFHNNIEGLNNFDIIATNPPWGAHFLKSEIKKLKKLYPQIKSFESFSYFLLKSLELTQQSGVVSFLLPESILNVKVHKDIREIILRTTKIQKIEYLGRIFTNVFTPVIRLDLEKNTKAKKPTSIYNINKKHQVKQIKWMTNLDFIFDINTDSFDYKIIDKIYQTQYITLKNKASWALGIVTGNNKQFLSSKLKKNFEPIYTGKDINKFTLSKASYYIQFQPEKFQQTAPEEKYRAKEKLIYKFISKKLVFAYDNQKRLTLNSANLLIPKAPDYPIKVILALFNSSLYQFLFQKKFFSIKVLRSHIENMPLPLWDQNTFAKIEILVNKIIKNRTSFQELDDYILSQFLLSQKEIAYIKKFEN